MKAAVFFSTLVFSSIAFAHSLPKPAFTINETLGQVEIDGKDQPRYEAELTVDTVGKEIIVAIWHDPCGSRRPARPGVVRCMAAAMEIANLRVPLQAVEDSCGSKVYSGRYDQTPVDGPAIEIRVTDNRTRFCEDMIPSIIVVEAESHVVRTQKTTRYYLMK